MSANRSSGVFFLLFGAALYWIVIPYDTETVGSGWVLPDSVPNAAAIVMMIAGGIQAAFPTGAANVEAGALLRALGLLVVSGVAVAMIGMFGFLTVAPGYVLLLMAFTGERRPLWYLVGVAAVPGVIWLLTVYALDRPLP